MDSSTEEELLTRTVHTTALVALALVLAACTGEATDSSTPASTVTTMPPTTTTLDAEAAAAATCDGVKLAIFDLEQRLSQSFISEEAADLSDEEAAVAVLGPVVGFYDELAGIAASAPSEVSSDMAALAAAVDPLRQALESGDPAALGLDQPEAPFDLASESSAVVDEWMSTNCATEMSLDPDTLIATTLFSAAFGALGEGLADLSEGFEDLAGDLDSLPDGDSTPNRAYGDDPELDVLWDGCLGGDDAACDDLYWQSFGAYEVAGQTCGGRAPFIGLGGNCQDRMDPNGPTAYGDDSMLDSLWDACEAGDPFSCDNLAASSPVGSDYARFGAGCGDVAAAQPGRSCQSPDDPFTYGDDPTLDALWDSCTAGDATACSDLYFDSPLSSIYEAIGDGCGALLERGTDCSSLLELVDGVG